MATILVTGSNGLIGKTLCKKLNQAAYTVRAIDNAIPASQANYGDITALDTIQKSLNDCDGIIHLAAVPFSVEVTKAQQALQGVLILNRAAELQHGGDAQGIIYANLWYHLLQPLSQWLQQTATHMS